MTADRNPFAFAQVCALPFVFEKGNWLQTWAKLQSLGGRGCIVGPHGSGKTTLLDEVATSLERRGLRVTRLFFNDRNRELPPDFRAADFGAGDALLVDGPQHLNWRARTRLRRARPEIFVITAHRPLWFETWAETKTSPQLLGELCAQLGVKIASDQAQQLWSAHRGDVRAAFWELYDRAARDEV